jgi:hypothetical protein
MNITSGWVEFPNIAKVLQGAAIAKHLDELPEDSWKWDKSYSNGDNAIEFIDLQDAVVFKLKFGL